MNHKKIIVILLVVTFILSSCSLLSKPSLDQAKSLAKDNKIQEAIDMIDLLIEEDEKNLELYLTLADIYMDDEDYRKVDKTLRNMSEIIEDNFDEDDEAMIDAIDEIIDFAIDLKRENESIGDWFFDFVALPEIEAFKLNLSKLIDTSKENNAKDDNSNKTNGNLSVGNGAFSYMNLTYGDIINKFGEPDTIDDGLNTVELIYDALPYTFMFVKENLSDSSIVGLISVTGPDGIIHDELSFIGENVNALSNDYSFSTLTYYDQSIMGGGYPIVFASDGSYYYMLFLDDKDNITDCFIQKEDYSSAYDYYAEDFLGYTLKEIKDIYGDLYYVDATEGNYMIMYFGMPYYFMFDASEPLNDNSIITTVSLEAGGKTMYGDPLMTMTESEFTSTYQINYDSVDYDDALDMAIVEGFGAYAIVVFDTGNYPNQVMVTYDLDQFGFGDNEDYIPYYGFDYVGYTYGELKTFIGEPINVDESGPYRYLEYDNVPYDFGTSLNETLTDDSIIYTVFIYFEEGGSFFSDFPYDNMSYDVFMEEEAAYYSGVEYFEEDNRLEFEDDYFYYYLFYGDGDLPLYMLIETK